MKGIITSGTFSDICIREKAGQKLELGELLIAENEHKKYLLHLFNLEYGSQLGQQHLELISGLKLEENTTLNIMDQHLRLYVLGHTKTILEIINNKPRAPTSLPTVFTTVRPVTKQDFTFLTTPEHALQIGYLRTGTQTLDVPVTLNGHHMLSHHVLVTGTTGRGKSVLMKYLLWNILDTGYAGLLVLDPHDEYYGRQHKGLSSHPSARTALIYYTTHSPPPGAITLRINITHIRPSHFNGITHWSDPQREALNAYATQYTNWIEAALTDQQLNNQKFGEATLSVIKRRLLQLLSLDLTNNTIHSRGPFTTTGAESTITDIIHHLHNAKTVIIDTKHLNGTQELLIGSIITSELFRTNKNLPADTLQQTPQTSIVLEEAPRVIGKDILEQGPNIFSTIAREGRKFHVGLIGITQLPSLIPREILANMNTKIILGTELKQERQAIIDSAAQDLTTYDHLIAALDKGEALITSTFTKFAMPLSIPNFDTITKQQLHREFNGINKQY